MTLPNRQQALADAIAGVSIAGLLLPEAVAYSGIANLPPQAGVIALFAGLVVYALLGRSRYAIISGTSSSAAVVAATTAALAAGQPEMRLVLAGAFVMLAGIVFLLAALARLGNATDFIAKPVLRGFTFGLAAVIILKQLPAFAGVAASGADMAHFSWSLFHQWPDWNLWSVATGCVALILLFVLAGVRNLPGPLVVIALGILANRTLDLAGHQVELVGAIRLDHLAIALPILRQDQWQRLAELSVALTLVLYSESSGSIRSFAVKHGDPVNPNRDLIALGVANLVSGLLRGMPVGAGYSATSANEAAGAQSQFAGLVAAATVLLLILTVLPWVAETPAAVLAAIVIHAVSHSLDPRVFSRYFRWQRDRLLVVVAVLAVLWLGVLNGLLVAVAISVAMALRGFATDRVAELGRLHGTHDFVDILRHPEAEHVPGVLILRPAAPVFFANVDRILGQVNARHASATARTVVLSLEETPDLDGTAIEALGVLAADIAQRGGTLLLARLKPPILDGLALAALPALDVRYVSFYSVDDAVRSSQPEPATTT